MKIHFIGLSCFLIENEKGYRVLVDPFNDSPEWTLGPDFPKEFEGNPFGANLVLMSEPDSDHAYAPGGWLQNALDTKPNSNPFPNLDLRGTVIYEYNGDVNIAYQYTIDDLRLAHFGDNAHILTEEQLKELGHPDIIFISPPKASDRSANEEVRRNIENLKPKVVFWAHHLAPNNLPVEELPEVLRPYFVEYFKDNASTSKGYQGDDSFKELGYVLENAYILNKEYSGVVLEDTVIEINQDIIDSLETKPACYLFRKMLARSKVE